MSIYIQTDLGGGPIDTGVRPLPAGAKFWESPSIFLSTAPGNAAIDETTYDPNQQEQVIIVVVNSNTDDPVPYVFVELWVCDPATIVGPDQALYPSEPVAHQPPPSKCLTGTGGPGGFSAPVQVAGFFPWPGMSSRPGGHACLIANCYGSKNSSGSPISDGQSLIHSTTAGFVSLVQDDAHVAQRNIFAEAMPGMSKRSPGHLSFPFNAVAAVRKGEEKVVLEIQHVPGDAELTKADLAFLRKGPYRGLPLHAGRSPLKAFAIDGSHGGPAKRVPIDVHAGHPVPLSILAEIGPGDPQVGVSTSSTSFRRRPRAACRAGSTF